MLPKVTAVSLIKPFAKGRTMPCLMLCRGTDGTEVEAVIKWRSDLETKDLGGICELFAALLADDLGLKTPKPVLIEIDPEFHRGIPAPALSEFARKSDGLNFGTTFLPGLPTWLTGRDVPLNLKQSAAETFAFDVLLDNPDRRREKPNLLSNGGEIILIDHEQAFSFLRGVIGWQPPWAGGSLAHLTNHVFFRQLKGAAHTFDRLAGALAAISDNRLDEYATLIPAEWISAGDVTERILDYLKQARDNRAALFAAVTRLLA